MKKLFDGHKLKLLRKEQGLTTQQVANELSISQSYISRFENNRAIPDVDMLASILAILGTDIATFFSSTPDLPPDLLQLLETAKKLSVDDRKLLHQFLVQFKGLHSSHNDD